MNISSGAVRALAERIDKWEKASKAWRDEPSADPIKNEPLKFDMILAGAAVVGYLQGLGIGEAKDA